MIAEKTLYILDAYAFIYRSFYAFNSKPLINSDGFNVVTKTTKVTGKGQVYFVNLFLGKQLEEKVG